MIQAEAPKTRLTRCDHLLDQLEELNLRDQEWLPMHLGADLRNVGIENPYGSSVSELIERVLDVQDEALRLLRQDRRRSLRLQLYLD